MLLILSIGCGTLSKVDSDNFKKQFDRDQDNERGIPNIPPKYKGNSSK